MKTNKILTRKEAMMIDYKYVLCQSKRAKYFLYDGDGWLSFRLKRHAIEQLIYRNSN